MPGADDLLPLVYEQLRALARQRMAQEKPAHTLQATALVHDAYLRLVEAGEIDWDRRAHFYIAAAEAMRRILVEHARRKGRVRHGGDARRRPLSVLNLAVDAESHEIVALDDAFRRLEESDGRAAAIVRLRFFAGLDADTVAEVLGLSRRTVMRDWAYARAWLFREVESEDQSATPGETPACDTPPMMTP